MVDQDARETALGEIARYSLSEAASLAGGLCLIPQNLHSLARLETLAHCCIAAVPRGKRTATRSNAQRLLNESLQAWVGFADDPADFPATQGFTFHEGTHILIAPSPGSNFAMRSLAVIGGPDAEDAPATRAHIARLIHFFCQVSNRVAMRSGLRRNMEMPETRALRVPPEATLRQFQHAVTLSFEEWQSILRASRLQRGDIAKLVAVASPARVDERPYHSDALGKCPFLQCGDTVIVVAPYRIADALVHHARELMAREAARAVLGEHYHGLLRTSVTSSVEHMGWRSVLPWRACGSSPTGTLLSEGVFQWDHSRLAHVVVMSDGCEAGTSAWSPAGLMPALAESWARFGRICEGTVPPVVERIMLLVMAPISGAASVSIEVDRTWPDDILVIPAWDLEALSQGMDDIAPCAFLGRYVRARRALRQAGCHVQAWAELDVIACWVAQDWRFPAGMDNIAVECDFSRGIRERALRNHDWHSVSSTTEGMLVEVGVAESPEFPIYALRHADPACVKIVVELSGRCIWFEMRRPPPGSAVDWLWAVQFVRMCAYWTAELLHPLPRRNQVSQLVLVVRVEPLGESALPPSNDGYIIRRENLDRLLIRVHPRFVAEYGATNETERTFARDLAQSIIGAFGEEHPGLVDAQLGQCAPVGPKRMMHAVDSAMVPEYSFSGELPPSIEVHHADVAELESALLVDASLVIPEGGLHGNDARDWLNRAVGTLFAQVRHEIARYVSRALLLRLMLNGEALLLGLAEEELTLASQLACFSRSSEFVERLREAGPRRAAAAMATRFLVELVACDSSSGTEIPGDLDVARLLALGLEIVSFGAASDVARYELGSVAVQNSGGQLHVLRGQFDVANSAVRDSVFAEQLARERSRTRISRVARVTEPKSLGVLGQKLSKGVQSEFGVTLEELASFFGDCVAMAQERREPVVVLPENDFVAQMAVRSALAPADLSELVRVFAQEPRDDYLRPPRPFRSSDVHPWRINRRLSYLQRPFVRTRTGELIFGCGHAHRAAMYLLGLMTSGRFKATSPALKEAMSAFTDASGKEFNAAVRNTLGDRGLSVRIGVTKFGKARMRSSQNQDLGDIDVLAIDHAARRLVAVECKDMEPDRMPHEVRSDLEALFIGAMKKPSAQDKHLKRTGWIRQHLREVTEYLGLQGDDWSVVPLMVLSRTMHSPLLGHAKLKVLTLEELKLGASLA